MCRFNDRHPPAFTAAVRPGSGEGPAADDPGKASVIGLDEGIYPLNEVNRKVLSECRHIQLKEHILLYNIPMAPLSFAVSRKVNPEGAEPLTAAQAWRGLQIKARNPTGFLPNVTMCEITEDHGRKVRISSSGSLLISQIYQFTRKVALMGMPPMLEDITEHEGAIASAVFYQAEIQ